MGPLGTPKRESMSYESALKALDGLRKFVASTETGKIPDVEMLYQVSLRVATDVHTVLRYHGEVDNSTYIIKRAALPNSDDVLNAGTLLGIESVFIQRDRNTAQTTLMSDDTKYFISLPFSETVQKGYSIYAVVATGENEFNGLYPFQKESKIPAFYEALVIGIKDFIEVIDSMGDPLPDFLAN